MKDGQIILFQGDSITDAKRNEDPEGLGSGYVRMVAKTLWALYPDKNLQIINRGISGHRVVDLEPRWEEDCIALKPDILFIYIGINDTWRRYDRDRPLSQERFESTYRRIIQRALEIGAKIVLIEPYLLPVKEGQEIWWEDLAGKQASVRRLSREFSLPLIPLDGILAAASAQTPMEVFSRDGVHPTLEGARVIAGEVLKMLHTLD